MVPSLAGQMGHARDAAFKAAALEGEMQELSQRIFLAGGLHVDVAAAARRRAERDKAMQEAREVLQGIEALGVSVDHAQNATLEFPAVTEGRRVWLCWQMGEEAITQWRETEDEPAVRREIDGRFGRGERERPN